MSRRVKVQGDYFHGKVPLGAVYIGRGTPGLPASPYANPFPVKRFGEAALKMFSEYLDRHPELVDRARRELAGKDVACWCKEGAAGCHGDEWLRRIAG